MYVDYSDLMKYITDIDIPQAGIIITLYPIISEFLTHIDKLTLLNMLQ